MEKQFKSKWLYPRDWIKNKKLDKFERKKNNSWIILWTLKSHWVHFISICFHNCVWLQDSFSHECVVLQLMVSFDIRVITFPEQVYFFMNRINGLSVINPLSTVKVSFSVWFWMNMCCCCRTYYYYVVILMRTISSL